MNEKVSENLKLKKINNNKSTVIFYRIKHVIRKEFDPKLYKKYEAL